MATLDEIRLLFIPACQRYDLVENGDLSSNVDNGANAFINGGQRFLDLTITHSKSLKRVFKALASGEYQVKIESLISLETIWVVNAANDRVDITGNWFSPAQFRREFGDLISTWVSGTPQYWSLSPIGLSPEQITATSDTFDSAGIIDYEDIQFGDGAQYEKDGILIYPPADGTYTIDIWGKFYSQTLSADADDSYWSVNHPDLLVMAACYALERTLKSREGMRDWLEAMKPLANAIDAQMVERDINHLNMRMRG